MMGQEDGHNTMMHSEFVMAAPLLLFAQKDLIPPDCCVIGWSGFCARALALSTRL